MKIKVSTFADGRRAFSSGTPLIQIEQKTNNKEPVSVGEYDVDDELGTKFMDNPTAYNASFEEGLLNIQEKA